VAIIMDGQYLEYLIIACLDKLRKNSNKDEKKKLQINPHTRKFIDKRKSVKTVIYE